MGQLGDSFYQLIFLCFALCMNSIYIFFSQHRSAKS